MFFLSHCICGGHPNPWTTPAIAHSLITLKDMSHISKTVTNVSWHPPHYKNAGQKSLPLCLTNNGIKYPPEYYSPIYLANPYKNTPMGLEFIFYIYNHSNQWPNKNTMDSFDNKINKIILYIICIIIIVLGINLIAFHLKMIGYEHYYKLSYMIVVGTIGIILMLFSNMQHKH